MTASRVEIMKPKPPRPVAQGRYRYSKLRWRIIVGVIDAVGAVGVRAWRLFRRERRIEQPRRILVVQLDHMGDAILSSPLVARLRAAYPNAVIDVLASPSNFEVFDADPNLDHVRVAEKNWFERRQGQASMLSAVWRLGTMVRGKGYELGIDVRGDILSVLVLALAGIPRRAGWAMGGGGFLLTDVATWVRGRHEVDSRMALLDMLNIPDEIPDRVSIQVADRDRVEVARALREVWPTRESRRSPRAVFAKPIRTRPGELQTKPFPARTTHPEMFDPEDLHAGRFGDESPLLVVHVGAGTAAKRWPLSHWNHLLGKFHKEGWRIAMVGGVDDVGLAKRMPELDGLADLTGRLSVTQTAALLERADLFIGADSGPSHLAACAGIASVVLFSGTNQVGQWRPRSRRTLVLRHKVACRPCHQKVCPLADHPCMTGLDPDRVHRAAKQWWNRLHKQESPHGTF